MADEEVAATRPRRRRWLRWLLLAVGVLVVAAIAVSYFFLPRVARPILERALSAALSTPVSIGSLTWEPVARRVTAEQVRLGGPDDANRLTVPRLFGEARLDRLWQGEIVLTRVGIDAPVGVLELDARYRPTLLAPGGSGTGGALLPDVRVKQLEVTGGELTVRYPVQGRPRDAQLHITRLDAADITTAGGGLEMRAQLEGSLDEAPLQAQLRMGAKGTEIEADVAVSGWAVHRDAVQLPAGLETFQARLDARAEYRSSTAPLRPALQLDARLGEPGITDAAGTAFTAKAIVLPDVGVDLITGAVVADRVAIEGPVGAVQLDAQYRPMLPRFGADETAATTTTDVAVRELVVTDGELTVRYPVGGTTRAVPLRITRLLASDIKAAKGGLAGGAELTGSLDGAPLKGRVHLGGGPVDAEVSVSGLAVDANTIDLPAGLETFAAKLDLRATYEKQTAPPSEIVKLDARLGAPRLSGEAGGEFRAKTVAIPDMRLDLATRGIELGTVRLDAPVVDLAITPEGVALPGLAGGGGTGSAWTVKSGRIELRDGRLRVRRGTSAVTLRVASTDWDGLAGGRPGPLALRATVEGGGTIAISGTLGSDPLAAALDVELADLRLPPLAELAAVLPLRLSKGTGGGTFRVTHREGRWHLQGQLRVRDMHSLPPDPDRPAEIMAVAVADADLTVETNGATAIDVGKLKLSYPYLLAERHRDGFFPTDILAGGAAPVDDQPSKAAPVVRIRALEIEDGKIEFMDTTLEPDYWTSLSHLSGEVSELQLPAATVGSFSISGKQDELSPIKASGAFTARGLEGQLSGRDVLLPSLNAFVSPLLGYDLTAGRLGVDATIAPKPPLLAAVAKVVVRGVEVRQTGQDIIQKQSGVPLPIALSLIANPSGEIDLTLPVTMDTRSRQFALGSVVGQAVRNAIVGALTTPLRILGNLFGKRGAPHALAIDPIPFPAGSGSPDGASTARLAEIARILHARPGLVLVALPQITAEDLAMVGDRGAPTLADERTAAVRDALTGDDAVPRLPSERLTLVPWRPPTGALPTGPPGVYVELQEQP